MPVSKDYLYPTLRMGVSPNTTHNPNDSGSWSGSTEASGIDEPQNAPDHNDSIWTGLGTGVGFLDRYWWVSYQLTQVLPGIAINKVFVRAWFGSHALSGQATVVNVELGGFLIIGGTRYMHGTLVTIEGTPAFVGFAPSENLWEWAINPATASAFTVDDLVPGAIEIGIRFRALNDPSAANTPIGRCSQLHLGYEYESSFGNLEQIRHVGSSELRRKRLPI